MSVIFMKRGIFREKAKFLEQFPPKASEVYGKIFDYSHELEKELDKDLSEFNLIELNMLFKSMKFNDVKKAISFGSVIRNYTTYMGKQSPLQNVDKSWYESFIK